MMCKDQLSACETMGNATNICTGKTGTLTENRMTVVQIWTARKHLENINVEGTAEVASRVKDLVAANCAVNSAAKILYKKDGAALARPLVIGSATEGALLLMLDNWLGENAWESLRSKLLDTGSRCGPSCSTPSREKVYPFNSAKKRSTVVSFLPDGGVRVYVKGATEWLMADATHFSNDDGAQAELTDGVRSEIDTAIASMADNALRTLCIAHRDFASKDELPDDWMEHPPDGEGLCVDAIVGIIDPLRPDVKDAVATAQRAGIFVRMVTGDNIRTAKAIARECGIFREGGIALEGTDFRKKTPEELDAILPKLQVLARSSPNDKLLLVSRLNGHGLPKDQYSWEERFPDQSFQDMKDKLLPGYLPDWLLTRGGGGEVVGVIGDGTSDAPALKAADVGLAMGTGTQVAKDAAEITILDDKFSSIVKAISWGRSLYDNIRKFLQLKLSVIIVAPTIVFIGVCGGFDAPLNAVMMLWVKLITDMMALPLLTELPTPEPLQRRPYNRDASLVSWPMWRNILCQSLFQLIILNMLLFAGESMFGVEHAGNYCTKYEVMNSNDVVTVNGGSLFSCGDWSGRVSDLDDYDSRNITTSEDVDLDDIDHCWNEEECDAHDYTHFTLIFNTFVFCQLFNEFNCRSIHSRWDVFSGVESNPMFMGIIAVTGLLQFILVTFGGEFTRTAPLTAAQWGISIGLGAISLPVGIAMRFIPVEENPDSFFGTEGA
uniref:Cation-transporting P-type ATPase C-terminal domain-containing protein n=1 Tax=Phaeomonas parva TaxID=124430 RepID=A0A7S1UCT0_9STRA|mmetsp:Transcript_41393/g.129638  ORF Transcript_41393/g.129638 Transcript_41393/m.129638 type:complete len:721 (+) Transcript_41393:311-2473(+)